MAPCTRSCWNLPAALGPASLGLSGSDGSSRPFSAFCVTSDASKTASTPWLGQGAAEFSAVPVFAGTRCWGSLDPWLSVPLASGSTLVTQPLNPSPHSHGRAPELTRTRTRFQPLGLSGRPAPAFLALSSTALYPAVYSSSVHIHFLEQICASVSLFMLFPLKPYPHFTCQSLSH